MIEIGVFVAFAWTDLFKLVDALFRARPRVHFAVGLAAFLGQLVPVFGLGQELAHRALRQAEYVLGEHTLTDVVHAEQIAHFLRYVGRVYGIIGVQVSLTRTKSAAWPKAFEVLTVAVLYLSLLPRRLHLLFRCCCCKHLECLYYQFWHY